MITNLGKALTILATQQAIECDMHSDVSAFGAPSECHGLVARGEGRRARRARKHAEAITRRPLRIIEREAKRRGCPIGSPSWDNLVGRLCRFPG